jgi:hypothetical protein
MTQNKLALVTGANGHLEQPVRLLLGKGIPKGFGSEH